MASRSVVRYCIRNRLLSAGSRTFLAEVTTAKTLVARPLQVGRSMASIHATPFLSIVTCRVVPTREYKHYLEGVACWCRFLLD